MQTYEVGLSHVNAPLPMHDHVNKDTFLNTTYTPCKSLAL